VALTFADDVVHEIARYAAVVNDKTENSIRACYVL
jgi:ATP-dependent protease HslVU (ClpYQ) ATPase subunit